MWLSSVDSKRDSVSRLSRSIVVLLHLVTFLPQLHGARPPQHHGKRGGGDGSPGSSFQCYSCMSRYYGATWKFFGYNKIYMEPRLYTDDCQEPRVRGSDVPTMVCQDPANCVTIIEDLQQGVGAKGYIRGCWSNIFLYGFNRTGSVGALATHQFCRNYNLTQLIAGGRPVDSRMSVCSCAGNYCNDSETNASPALFGFLLLIITLLPLTFL